MTLLVSVEDDLIGPTLEYHFARGVDFAVVTANRASDAVLDTIQRYVDEDRAHLILEPGDTHAQGPWATRMARLAATDFGADWVVNLDADEFYWPEAAGDLKTVFEAVPQRWGSVVVPLCHFLPPHEQQGFFADAMTVRETRSLKPSGRHHFTKVAHRGSPDVVVSRGLHRISGVDLPPVPGWRPILGLHFPMRSYEQFVRKVVKSGEAAERSTNPVDQSKRNIERLEAYRAGRLPEIYRELQTTEEDIAAGLAEGRLVRDRRLADFFAAGLPQAQPGDVEEVRLGLAQAAHEWERSEDHLEAERLRKRLERTERRLKEVKGRVRALEAEKSRRPVNRLAAGVALVRGRLQRQAKA